MRIMSRIDLSKIPGNAVGLRLCKIIGGELVMCEPVIFSDGRNAVALCLRRAQISGSIGPIGETGEFWADFMDMNCDWQETIALSRGSWNALKRRWMRCRIQREKSQ